MPKPVPIHSSPCSLRRPLHASSSFKPSISRFNTRHTFVSSHARLLAQPRNGVLGDPWLVQASSSFFSQADPRPLPLLEGLNGNSNNDHKPPDERIIKLGKTLRTLSPLLPTILFNALPSTILSPSIALHLFPSTHPHLPTVKGRTLYRAALWTVPVAWSSLPLVGNVKLQILSERIVRAGTVLDPDRRSDSDCGDERLVVRWKTEPREGSGEGSGNAQTAGALPSVTGSTASSKNGVNKSLSKLLGGDAPIFKLSKEEQFTGLFIFSFDEEGRILTHTIEHADNANGWDRTAKFVTLTDWLIGKARGSLEPAAPGLAIQSCSILSLERGRHASRP